jgi:large-conductance mechanosensitive channel
VSPTPTLPPDYTGDPNLVSPGVIGFIVIFLIAAATVLLVIDMTRRIRRLRYREEAQQKIAAEKAGEVTPPAPED